MTMQGGDRDDASEAANDRVGRRPKTLRHIESDHDKSPSALRVVLTDADARHDLWTAQPPLLYSVFDCLRNFVFDPALAVSCVLLPPLLHPAVDKAIAVFLKVAIFFPLRTVYCRKSFPSDIQTQLRAGSARDLSRSVILQPSSDVRSRMPRYHPPSDSRAAFLQSVSFAVGAVGDIVGVLLNPTKMKHWADAMGQMKAYLDASGVGDELEEAIIKPMLKGRLLDNLKILSAVQEKQNSNRHIDNLKVIGP